VYGPTVFDTSLDPATGLETILMRVSTWPSNPADPNFYDPNTWTAVHQYHVQLTPGTDLHQYCETLLRSDLKSGQIARVDSPPDYVTGGQDEGRALLASH
jgi:hypothetical protein